MKPDKRWVTPPETQLTTPIQIKHRDTGAIIFEREIEGNTLAKTLRMAIILKIDVRHADLSGSDLSHGFFMNGDFSYCDLTGATLTGADFAHAKFIKASMSGIVDSYRTIFEEAIFDKVYAPDSNFKYANFNNAIGQECNFGEQTVLGKVVIPGSDFSGCDLRGFGTRGANFRGIITDENTLLDETDTRIAYRAPRIAVPKCSDSECDPNCRQSCRKTVA